MNLSFNQQINKWYTNYSCDEWLDVCRYNGHLLSQPPMCGVAIGPHVPSLRHLDIRPLERKFLGRERQLISEAFPEAVSFRGDQVGGGKKMRDNKVVWQQDFYPALTPKLFQFTINYAALIAWRPHQHMRQINVAVESHWSPKRRVAVAGYAHKPVAIKDLRSQMRGRLGQEPDRQIGFTPVNQRDSLCTNGVDDHQVNAGRNAGKLAFQRRQNHQRRVVSHGDGETSTRRAGNEPLAAQSAFEVFERSLERAGQCERPRRQLHAIGGSNQQLIIEQASQPAKSIAHGRLG